MLPRALPAVLGVLLGLSLDAASAGSDPSDLNRAAALYHQARFDSARVRLETLLAETGWRRRDSLVLYQYLGMSSSRLGADSDAVDRFGRLLELDSLFQFPSNEDPAILRNFHAAREARHRSSARFAGPPAVGGAGMTVAGAGTGMPHRLSPPPPGGAPWPGPDRPETAPPSNPLLDAAAAGSGAPRKRMNLALGAVPLGGGWLARERTGHALTLGLLQGGGLLLSLYASRQQSQARDDRWGTEEGREADRMVRWQWVQAVSLSTAVGAYLFSIFASGGG